MERNYEVYEQILEAVMNILRAEEKEDRERSRKMQPTIRSYTPTISEITTLLASMASGIYKLKLVKQLDEQLLGLYPREHPSYQNLVLGYQALEQTLQNRQTAYRNYKNGLSKLYPEVVNDLQPFLQHIELSLLI